MKRVIKAVNALLKPVGLRLSRTDEPGPYYPKLLSLIEEAQGCFVELLFPELPASKQRTALLAQSLGTQVSEAMYIIAFLHKALDVDGDVCEFGIAQGATSALLANEIRETRKLLWLFDSFEGLPQPSEKDILIDDIFGLGSMDKYAGTMRSPAAEVKSRLADISFPFSRVQIVPGFIEASIHGPRLPGKVCFAYVDFDFYRPILVALQFLDKCLVVGGYVVIDDYGYFSAGAKTAVDEFLAENPTTYELILPHKFAGHFAIVQKIA